MDFQNITCDYCGQDFNRNIKQIKRSKKLGLKGKYCNQTCLGKWRRLNNISFTRGSKRSDEYSKFRSYLSHSRVRNKNYYGKEFNITLEDLKNQWEKQGGICPYTNIKMEIGRTTGSKLPKTPNKASLDRIDSTKGYVVGNIEFVCMLVNYAKNNFTSEQVKCFFGSLM